MFEEEVMKITHAWIIEDHLRQIVKKEPNQTSAKGSSPRDQCAVVSCS